LTLSAAAKPSPRMSSQHSRNDNHALCTKSLC
jgi:hypothetical protein